MPKSEIRRGEKIEVPPVDRDHLSEMAMYFNSVSSGNRDWLIKLAEEQGWGHQVFALMSGLRAIMIYHGDNWLRDPEMFDIVFSRIIEYLDRMSPPGTAIQKVKKSLDIWGLDS